MPELISFITLFFMAAAVAVGIVILSSLVGRGVKSREKLIPYECGVDPIDSSGKRISIKFFLVAILFIIFDVEVVLLYPWAIVFGEFCSEGRGILAFGAAAVFLGVLLIGLIYAWGKGALEWE